MVLASTASDTNPAFPMRRFFLGLFMFLLAVALAAPAIAAEGIAVYYAGPEGAVQQALAADPAVALTPKAANAEVYVLNGSIPVAPALAAGVNEGAGLILILGPNTQLADIETLLRVPVTLTPYEAPESLQLAAGADDPLLSEVAWASAPSAHTRYVMEGFALAPLVAAGPAEAVVVGRGQVGAGRVFVVTTPFGAENPQLQEWVYFDYLIHYLTLRAAGRTPQSVAAFSAIGLPTAGGLAAGAALVVIVAVGLWIGWRRWGRRP